MTAIPVELLDQIVAQCDPQTLPKCALVHPSWIHSSRVAFLSTKTITLNGLTALPFIGIIQHPHSTVRPVLHHLRSLVLDLWTTKKYPVPGTTRWAFSAQLQARMVEERILDTLVASRVRPSVVEVRKLDFTAKTLTTYPSLPTLLFNTTELNLSLNLVLDFAALRHMIHRCYRLESLTLSMHILPLSFRKERDSQEALPGSLRHCSLGGGCAQVISWMPNRVLDSLSFTPRQDRDYLRVGKCLGEDFGLLVKDLTLNLIYWPLNRAEWDFKHQHLLTSLSLIITPRTSSDATFLVRSQVFELSTIQDIRLIIWGDYEPVSLRDFLTMFGEGLRFAEGGSDIRNITVVGDAQVVEEVGAVEVMGRQVRFFKFGEDARSSGLKDLEEEGSDD